jgi:hypothetical protein
MQLLNEPGTRRLFVSVMTGPLYTVSYDGKTVGMYVGNAPQWEVSVQSQGSERGFQSFAFHPQLASLAPQVSGSIQEKNARQGKMPATRADLRFGEGPDGRIFLINKRDGIIRQLVGQ